MIRNPGSYYLLLSMLTGEGLAASVWRMVWVNAPPPPAVVSAKKERLQCLLSAVQSGVTLKSEVTGWGEGGRSLSRVYEALSVYNLYCAVLLLSFPPYNSNKSLYTIFCLSPPLSQQGILR